MTAIDRAALIKAAAKVLNPWGDAVGPILPTRLDATRDAVRRFRRWLSTRSPSLWRPLRGHDLTCWCPLEDSDGRRVPCHADVLLELANGGAA